MKRILGLDLGTNSIGWSVIEDNTSEGYEPQDRTDDPVSDMSEVMIAAGSRIIPMDAATLGDYRKGNLESAASERTGFRGMRRLYERSKLRRERLLRVLQVMGFLPEHFSQAIDFECRYGKFKGDGDEPLIAYEKDEAGHRRFIFMDAFREMLADFAEHQPELVANGRLVPYDWTIYYLRQKALRQAITPQELAWLLLHFNAKRGYYHQLGDELDEEEVEEKPSKTEEYCELTVTKVEQMEADKKKPGYYWYEITYDNGATQRRTAAAPPRQVGERVEVIVTTNFDRDGNIKKDKEGKDSIKLRTPKPDDWTLMKKRTEHNLQTSGNTAGEYIYNHLLANPRVKVRGKLIHTIERRFYKDELTRILNCQRQYMPQFSDPELLERCARELYRHNENHVQSLLRSDLGHDLVYLLVEDILFYHRPLKSKKSEIDDCPYESRYYTNHTTGERIRVPLKCIPKSHPLFQEYRLWQFISNLHIYKRQMEVGGRLQLDVDVTDRLLPDVASRVALFDWLNEKKEIKQDQLLRYPAFDLKKTVADYRWNYVEDRIYPCNETAGEVNRRTDKAMSPRLSADDLLHLWHIAYSVKDTEQRMRAFRSFATSRGMNSEAFANAFRNYDPSKDGYGAYSEKAIRKLLSVMRMGRYWSVDNIDAHTLERINHLIDGEADDSISQRVRNLIDEHNYRQVEQFSGLSVSEACYVVYDRHSEATDLTRWNSPSDIDVYLNHVLRHNSLRNPIVEKVITETLKVVRDIWRAYGSIDEVHIEMGRDLKRTAQERADDSDRMLANERTNLRIRALLQEFAKAQYDIAGVRPNSPMQQEKLKIYEEAILANYADELPDDVRKIVDDLGKGELGRVSAANIQRYRLYLEQKYVSPYTGRIIPLSRLFTREYEIEHIIPQSLYFDDSLSNKVICETEVNHDKGNMLGFEYISTCGGKIIPVVQNGVPGTVRVSNVEEYTEFVKSHYAHNRNKMKRLLMDEIPDGFINRQLNDSRYMSRKMLSILSCLVREPDELEATSKHVISTSGSITDKLKADWGLKDVWNRLMTPRFERLNKMTKSQKFGHWVDSDGQHYFQTEVPLELSRDFSKKRIDHRHHAMDAIVIACTTRSHINYLNNQSALSPDERKSRGAKQRERDGRRRKLCYRRPSGEGGWLFRKPWRSFTQDVCCVLNDIVVSFKQDLRIITRTSNFYTRIDADGHHFVAKQTKGDGFSIRKSLHKATVHGLVDIPYRKNVRLSEALNDWQSICDKPLRKYIRGLVKQYGGHADTKLLVKYFKQRDNKFEKRDISRVDVWRHTVGAEALTATRVTLNEDFKSDKEIDEISDSGIRAILKAHLHSYDTPDGKLHPELAFSPEGLVDMNNNIRALNGGRDHMPIFKVRKTETKGMKFAVGESGNKKTKFVEADKGTNLFFAIYVDAEGRRSFETIPFNLAVERRKQGLSLAPDLNECGHRLLFILSPYDLVYVPTEGEHVDLHQLDRHRIYKMVSCTKNSCLFVPMSSATSIVNGFEYEKLNKMEKTIDDGVSIKNVCLKLTVDRLGRITHLIGNTSASL